MKKLWVVQYEAENVVYAETREEAEELGRKFQRDAEVDIGAVSEIGTCLPYAWAEDCIPYGYDELTIGEILAAGKK